MRFFDKLNTLIAVLVVLVFFLILSSFLFYRHQQSMQSVNDASASAEETAASPTSEETHRLRVAVRAEDAPAWVRIRKGGTVVFDRSVEPGFYRGEGGTVVFDQDVGPGFYKVFEADEPIIISTDNAGAVRVESDGKDLGLLGKSGEAGAWTVHRTNDE